MSDFDSAVRAAAFAAVGQALHPVHRTITWARMKMGFVCQGRRWSLVGPQGIFKPAGFDLPLSILSSPIRENAPRKYEDALAPEGFLVYKYRGTDPDHPDNVGLRACIGSGTPLIYFFGLTRGLYEVVLGVRVLSDDREHLQFMLTLDEGLRFGAGTPGVADPHLAQRSYRTREVFRRLHQASFRRRVLDAYGSRCAVCSLRHEELLEAAHIIPDSDPRGLPVVKNGMAMCNLHHAAYDAAVMGIRPDLVIEIRKDVMEEEDGPMLRHGLQGVNGKEATAPRSRLLRPDPAFLEERYDAFRRTG